MIPQELIDMAKDCQSMIKEDYKRVLEGEDPNNPELIKLRNQAMKIIHDLENKCEEKSIDICSVFKLADN